MNTEKTNTLTDAITALKEEAAKNDEFAVIMYVLANRERTRRNLDLIALQRTMEQHGADFKREAYEHVISVLGNLGFGRVKLSSSGKILGLTDINTTLQSIGQASAGKTDKLEQFKQKRLNKFKKLPDVLKPSILDKVEPPIVKSKAYELFLTVIVNKAPIVIPGPANLKPEDLGEFLVNFNNLVKGHGGNA